MHWTIEYTQEAAADLEELDHSRQIQVLRAIRKVSANPLPQAEGGYGKPLGNKHGRDLTGLLKIKLKALGIRVVYQLKRERGAMVIVVIAVREDDAVYRMADKRLRDGKTQ